MRLLTFVALVISTTLTGVAGWQITRSPDAIDDIKQSQAAAQTPAASETIVVTIDPGATPQDIGKRLERMGVIDSSTQFRVLVSFLGYDGILQAGEYEFQRGSNALDAVYRLRRGLVSTRSVTIVEGWRLEEVADAFAAEGIDRDEFLEVAGTRFDVPLLKELDEYASIEGYLFPATYPIRRGQTPAQIILAILDSFAANAADDLRVGAGSTGLSEHEIVTLASIIEREAQVPADRPIMAQVFLSRLAQGMPLDADPTVQYAVAQDQRSVAAHGYWKANLTTADLRIDSPYNTYQYQGLPPGPICNPGLASIQAVLNPSGTNFLYFVAKPDGSHLFAETFEEHLENIEKAQAP